MKLKDLCKDERPREKMLEKGAFALSNVELLAILLRTGAGEKNAMDVSRELLKTAGNRLGEISRMSIDAICTVYGIGKDKATTVTAAFELGRRCAAEEVFDIKDRLTSPEIVCRIRNPLMKNLKKEECWVLFLNKGNRLICKEMISSGSIDATAIDNISIAKRCIEKQASGLILVHNHPSGNSYPSKADLQITELLKKTMDTCGVRLLDHIIIAQDNWYSFSDETVCSKKF